MKISIEIDETALKNLVYQHIARSLGSIRFSPENVAIQVKSKQNYKSEWEFAEFRAVCEVEGEW